LFIIEVVCEDDEPPADTELTTPTISLHALTGVQHRSGRTLQVLVTMNGAQLMALLDSNSTHNFIETEMAWRAGIKLRDDSGLHVAIANGDRLSCAGRCPDLAPLTLLAVSAEVLDDLLQQFVPLFETPTGLPLPLDRMHQIRLVLGTAPVVIQSYRYAHNQKLELEKQCADMLRTGVIRPSTSAFSVLLVKKGMASVRSTLSWSKTNS
jgi:hypothetical protein